MNYLEELAARRRFGMKPGLESIRRILRSMGDPLPRRVVHVAGTNGKGAVCAILDSALRAAGFSVGRYTSPHLIRLNERFWLNGAPIDNDRLESAALEVLRAVNDTKIEDLTFFEALTAAAFYLYAASKCEWTILETGLGGRLDATNVCSPILTIITAIGLDHCDWLGDTLEKIASEKAGIIKSGVPVVLGKNCDAVRAVVESVAKERGAPFVYAPELAQECEIPAGFSLSGVFNRENAVTALAALKTLGMLNPHSRSGFAKVVWPGRFQRVGRFIIDGAHNPPAAEALLRALDAELAPEVKLDLIAGFCADKDAAAVLRILAPRIRRGFAVKTVNPRSLTAEATAELMRSAGIDATACPSLADAVSRSGEAVICGSLFLAGQSLAELGAISAPAHPENETIYQEALKPFYQ